MTWADIVGGVLMIWLRRAVVAAALATAAAVLTMAAAAGWVGVRSRGHVYAESDVPPAPVALVLGAEVYYPSGQPSPFLEARLEIARRLYADGKVTAVLVSGDHMHWSYNEPGAMFTWLVAHGVPTDRIALDHAGFDTYDSCARAGRIFGVRRAIVVTQSFHIDRAVALCRSLGVEADGVADESVRVYRRPWRSAAARERGAAVKALLDVASGRDPVFLGPQETSVQLALHP